MFSTWTLVIITIAQLSSLVLRQHDFELIIDKATLVLLLILLYCRGSFKHNYIKAFILMLIILTGLLIINKLGYINFSGQRNGELWKAYNQVEIISKTAIL